MPKTSAGILLYRVSRGLTEIFLVHPGGPFWAKKDQHAWSIPKGEYAAGEDPLNVAKREFEEETGMKVEGDFMPLTEVTQPGGKKVKAWAVKGDCDPSVLHSNTFEMEWPPGSGKICEFPEVDRAEWFPIPIAESKILKGQLPLLNELARHLAGQER